MRIVIDAHWDDEAGVWYAVARDKVGLATEAPSLDGLRERILSILPDVLESTALPDVQLIVTGIEKRPQPIAAE